MKSALLRAASVAAVLVTFTFLDSTPAVAATCTWTGATDTTWNTATNWDCGHVPTTGDTAVINGSSTPTVSITAVAAGSVDALQVINNASATLAASAAVSLAINGGGTGLQVGAGSTLTLGGTSAITIALPSGTGGTVAGAMSFGGAAHRMTALAASPVTFQSGSSFTADTGFSGNPFGTANLNSIVFASGSRYVFKTGSNPFGAGQPNSVVVFQTGSLYLHQGTGTPSFSGRTYANFELNQATTISGTGGNPLSIDNLTVTLGTLNLGMTGTFNLKGNVSVAGGATLAFNAAGAANITMNGGSTQTIGGTGALTFVANETLVLNNANGLTLLRDVTLGGPLTLTNGDVTTGAFTLTLGGTVGGVGDVVGTAKRLGPFTPTSDYRFNNANTLVNFNSITTPPGDITIQLAKSAPAGLVNAIPRQYTINTTASGTFDATLRLGYLQSEVDANPAIVEAGLGAWKSIASVWTAQPGAVDIVNNFVTATNVTSFSDWAIAPTGASTPPSGVGQATPGAVAPAGTTLLTVTVTPGTNPASTGLAVTADLTAIGGSATQTLYDDGSNGDVTPGDNVFSYSATVGAVSSGAKSLPFTVSDSLLRTGTGSIALYVTTRIHDVQGSTPASPLLGSVVAIDGIVVGSYQGASGLGGFFVEEPDANWDGDAATSEGIFVFSTATSVAVGDRVTAIGTVTESFGLTELASVTSINVLGSNNTLPTAVEPPVPAPSSPAADWERFEGMRVSFSQTLYMTDSYNMGKYGEIGLASGARLQQPTNFIDPNDNPASGTSYTGSGNVAAVTTQATANTNNFITLDDGYGVTNYSPEVYLPLAGAMRLGTAVSGITGVLTYQFGLYMIEPAAMPTFTPAPRPPSPPSVGSPGVKVGFQNTLNFFVNTRDVQPPTMQRGAADAAELARQRAKLIAALSGLGADVIGLSELEKDPTTLNAAFSDNAAAQSLASGLTTATGHAWAATVDPWTCETDGAPWPCNIGTDPDIKCGIIYDTTKVTPVGASFTDLVAAAGTYSRGPYAQVFTINATGGKFAVVVNHLRSKGCTGASGGDADQNDGQGCFNARRRSQALATSAFVASASFAGVPNVLLVGDMNAYGEEDPIDAFRANGFVDVIGAETSYSFSGQSGHIDHALASSSLAPYITGAGVWHINADEPIVTDFVMGGKPADAPYAADAYRSSDHDPVIVGIMGTVPVELTSFTAE